MRRIGVLLPLATKAILCRRTSFSAFMQALAELGWTDGRNVRMDCSLGRRQRRPDTKRSRKELVDLQPDIILSYGNSSTTALQRATRTIPIVFANVNDPVGSRFVAGLASPGRNITGFINIEAGLAGKWLELLTEIAPRVKRAAIMFNPDTAASGGSYFLPSFEAAARSLKIEPITAPVRGDAEMKRS